MVYVIGIQGCYTYISQTGYSVNNYFILLSFLYALVHATYELYVTKRIGTDHMPLKVRVMFPKEDMYNAEADNKEQIIEKFVLNSGNEQLFTDLMCTDETCTTLDRAITLIDIDIEEVLCFFNYCIKQTA